jgi:hypothetical protein
MVTRQQQALVRIWSNQSNRRRARCVPDVYVHDDMTIEVSRGKTNRAWLRAIVSRSRAITAEITSRGRSGKRLRKFREFGSCAFARPSKAGGDDNSMTGPFTYLCCKLGTGHSRHGLVGDEKINRCFAAQYFEARAPFAAAKTVCPRSSSMAEVLKETSGLSSILTILSLRPRR